ncbi:hypothetical protein RDABS01_005964 [Bienertia sinuspersici]
MARFQNFNVKLSLFFFMLLSLIIISIALDQTEENGINPILTSLYSSWDKVKSLAQEAQKRFLPPNLDFRIQEKDAGTKVEDSSKRIKEAAKQSFEEGEVTLEKAAESAATAMDNAVHKAKDKVEHKFSQDHGRDAEEL